MISSFVNKLSGCSLSRGSTLILIIWYPWSSDCHFSPCFQFLHVYAPLSSIWNKQWYCKCSCKLKGSWCLILKTWGKHIVKLSRDKKVCFTKRDFILLHFWQVPFFTSSYGMVISIIPCAMYSIYSENGGKHIRICIFFVLEIRFWFFYI